MRLSWAGSIVLFGLAAVQDTDSPCRVHGRLLDPAGAPLAGAQVTLHGWQANSQRVQAHGLPKDWQDPAPVETGKDGFFELSVVPPRAYQFSVDVTHADYAKIGWRWSELPVGGAKDLGETRLELPGIVVGHIVDAAGNLLVEGWLVTAWHRPNEADGREGQPSHTQVDPDSGTFRIADLPPGRIEISAEGNAGQHIRDQYVETVSGQPAQVQLVYTGPDPETRLVVSISSRPFYAFKPAGGTVHAIDRSGVHHALAPVSGRASDWDATGLEPGAYTVEIDDPRFEPLRMESVHTGRPARAQLVGSAGVRLTVRDSSSAEPIGTYGLRFEYLGVNFTPNVFTLAEDGTPAPQDGLFRGIVPGEIELEVRAAGLPPQRFPVPALAPGETRDVEALLEPGRSLAGRVVLSDGSPAAGIRVQLTRGEVAGHDIGPDAVSMTSRQVDGESRQIRIGYRDAETETDAEGRFEFPGLSAGKHALRALASRWCAVDALADVTREEPEALAPTLTLPPLGGLDLVVALPEAIGADSLQVEMVSTEFRGRLLDGEPLDASGSCSLSGLPAGAQTFRLNIRYRNGENGYSGTSLELGTVEIEPDRRMATSFDLRSTFPMTGTLDVLVGGVPVKEVDVRLEPADLNVHRAWLTTEDAGRSYYHVAPGTYRIRVTHAQQGWQWVRPEELQVRSGERFAVQLDVPVVRRAVRVVDTSGAAVPSTEIAWWSAEMRAIRMSQAQATTDAEGLLALPALPPGSYRFARAATRNEGHVEVAWQAGEEPLEIRLPRDP